MYVCVASSWSCSFLASGFVGQPHVRYSTSGRCPATYPRLAELSRVPRPPCDFGSKDFIRLASVLLSPTRMSSPVERFRSS